MLYVYDKEDDKYYSKDELIHFAYKEIIKARMRYGTLVRNHIKLENPLVIVPALIKCAKVQQTMIYKKLERITKLLIEFDFPALDNLLSMADLIDVTPIMDRLQHSA